MELTYWIVAVLLGLLYLYAGGAKLVRSKEQLMGLMEWVETTSMPVVRGIGGVEVVGVVGLILPPLLGVAPALALVAAIGFIVLQILATGVHLSRGDGLSGIGINVVLIALAVAAAATWLATDW